jgi:NAD-dependent SIR2 family protein deacetylase
MTKENRTVIELSDIVAVEFECLKCHSTYAVPISTYTENLPYCPQCKNKLLPAVPGNADASIRHLLTKLKDVMEIEKNSDLQLGVKIRFRIADE